MLTTVQQLVQDSLLAMETRIHSRLDAIEGARNSAGGNGTSPDANEEDVMPVAGTQEARQAIEAQARLPGLQKTLALYRGCMSPIYQRTNPVLSNLR